MKNEQIAKAKQQASRLVARLGELGIEVKHGQALEGLAAVFGAENWHAFAAELKKPRPAQNAAAPLAAEPFGHKWVKVKLLAGDGAFRATAVRLASSLDDAIAQAKAELWTPVASSFPAGVVAITEVLADVSTLEGIEAWLTSCDVNEWVLDDEVVNAVQERGLGELNTLEHEADQENHISDGEQKASDINNGGLSEQLAFLFQDYENDIPGFVTYLQRVCDLYLWW